MSRIAGSMGIFVIVLTVPAIPARADDAKDWLAGEHATGDWGGLRDTLKDAGITPEVAYTTDLMALHNGNAGSGEGWDYAERVDASLDFDLEKLAGIPGLSLYASGAWSSGSDLSERQVGNIFAVQRIFTGGGRIFLHASWRDRQSRFSGRGLLAAAGFVAPRG